MNRVAAAEVRDLGAAAAEQPAVWREVRRFDPPAQAALLAAHRVLAGVADPAKLALVAVAPTQAGSPEMFQWVRRIAAGEAVRMNPVHTLHAVDNLALSALSLALGARGYGVSLGGAAGVEAGRALLAERLRTGPETQGILFWADQRDAEGGGPVVGFAERYEAPPAPAARVRRRVVVTGLGAVSALGTGVHALWSGLLAGRSGLSRVPEAAAMGLPVTSGGRVPFAGPDRDVRLGQAALAEALAGAGWRGPLSGAGFYWACALDTFQVGEAGLVHRPASACFQALAAPYSGPHRMLAVACASGTRTVGEAFQAIRRGELDCAVAGGSAVMLTPFYLIGFAALRAVALDEDAPDPAASCRPFDATRAGFALADGAGALVLEALEHAQARGAPILAEVLGLGTSMDAFDLSRPPEDGRGALACLADCLADAHTEPRPTDVINAHSTGTRIGDVAEAAAIQALYGERAVVHGVKGALGHAMAAAGALEAVVAVQSLRHGVVPPTVGLARPDERCALDHVVGAPRPLAPGARILSASYGMGGQNASILLGKFGERPSLGDRHG